MSADRGEVVTGLAYQSATSGVGTIPADHPAARGLRLNAAAKRPWGHGESPARRPARPEHMAVAAASRTGLQLPSRLTLDKWLSIGQDLAATASFTAWCLGDWLLYGETAFSGRYRSAIEQTSLDYKTLRNYAWVARKFPHERRHETLSFGHHAEVAGLPSPEQDFWLRKAEAHGWSRNMLRHGVRTSLREREEPTTSADGDSTDDEWSVYPEGSPPSHDSSDRSGSVEADAPDATGSVVPPVRQLSVLLTPQQLEVIRKAATSARLTIVAWATQVLEHAARSAVSTEI
jgi:hypothetical protein